MGKSDNLSCLMNASVHLKQVVTSDANVGRQLKFCMGEFCLSVHSQLHFNGLGFFFLSHELDLSSINGGYYAAGNHFPLKCDNIQCESADGYKVFTALEGIIIKYV